MEKLTTGLIDLDHMWGDLKPGYVYLIASRPSMGKTALALNMLQHLAIKENHKVVYFSLEQSKEQLSERLLSMESGVEQRILRDAKAGPEDEDSIASAAQRIGSSNLVIDDTHGINVEAIARKLSEEIMSGVEVVIIDYLQLLNTDQIEQCCKDLKTTAETNNVAMIVLSQVSGSVEDREDHRPGLGDCISENAADYFANISFIYRDGYYNSETDAGNIAEIITVKNIFGEVGNVKLIWRPADRGFCNQGVVLK